jgi:hypothetical protein
MLHKRPFRMSLEQTLEDERQELLRNLDGLKSSKGSRNSNSNKTTGRRASVSSPLASSSPWTNTLLSEWDDGLYEPSDADEPEPERRASDSVAVTQRRREKQRERERERKKEEVDIDAGFLYGIQPSVKHGAFSAFSLRSVQAVVVCC